ncbi:MAG: zinc ribbon domain-containing protein, partial [Nitrosomonadales bacterium]|nr:zinc ribbon domain-containing protein [Nitrosomonadales bacterium]
MPIYEFICEDCHYQEDLMRKISEPTKILCPKCDNQNFVKQVSAANF